MTDNEKLKIVDELKALTANYFNSLKDILIKNDLVYAVEQKTMIYSAPFGGYMPKICNDMLEDLCLDIVNHPTIVEHELHEKSYVAKKIAEYEECHSPKSRILQHMSEIERLKEKYHVTDEDLRK